MRPNFLNFSCGPLLATELLPSLFKKKKKGKRKKIFTTGGEGMELEAKILLIYKEDKLHDRAGQIAKC